MYSGRFKFFYVVTVCEPRDIICYLDHVKHPKLDQDPQRACSVLLQPFAYLEFGVWI